MYKVLRFFLLVTMSLPVLSQPQSVGEQHIKQLVVKTVYFLKSETDLEKRKIIVKNNINPLLVSILDFDSFTKIILGKHRKKINKTNFAELKGLTQILLLHVYGNALLSFDNQKVSVLPVLLGKNKKRMTVSTEIINTQKSGSKIRVDYVMRLKGDRWLVYDLVVEKIRLSLTYRTSVNEIIAKQGIDGLLKSFRAKVKKIKE